MTKKQIEELHKELEVVGSQINDVTGLPDCNEGELAVRREIIKNWEAKRKAKR